MQIRGFFSRLVGPVALIALVGMTPTLVLAEDGERQYEMVTYQFVLLRTGPDDSQLSAAESHSRQQAHLEFLQALIDSDQAIIVGPVHDAGRLRGILVLDVGSVEKAHDVLAHDPWISTGRLVAEIHSWWAAKGILQKPTDILDHRAAWLGLLFRPEDAPELSDERLQELQSGHMKNIRRMADSGDLVLAGPMDADIRLRGIFMFRTETEEQVRAMVARDPSVVAGRLEVELYAWTIPRESFPER